MSWWVWKLVLLMFALYAGIALALFFLQRKLVFVPDPQHILPAEVDLTDVREVKLTTENGLSLFCWYGAAKAGKPTLLFFHGNGGNVAGRQDKFHQLMAEGYGVFMLGYRGYGGSEGKPSEAAFVKDAGLAYDFALNKLGLQADNIVIYGESIGTSVATQLAARVKARALVLEAPMSSVTAVAQERYPYVRVRPFLRDRFESDKHIAFIQMPLLVVHGGDDRVIPLKFGQALFDAAVEPKEMQVIKGGGHNDLYDFDIVKRVDGFLQSLDK